MKRRELFTVGTLGVAAAAAAVIPSSAQANTDASYRLLIDKIKVAMSQAARERMFEINDDFLRANYTAWMEYCIQPYMDAGIIHDFQVFCDASNNPPDFAMRGGFAADVYIKPTKESNFTLLNMTLTRSGVRMEELKLIGTFGS